MVPSKVWAIPVEGSRRERDRRRGRRDEREEGQGRSQGETRRGKAVRGIEEDKCRPALYSAQMDSLKTVLLDSWGLYTYRVFVLVVVRQRINKKASSRIGKWSECSRGWCNRAPIGRRFWNVLETRALVPVR